MLPPAPTAAELDARPPAEPVAVVIEAVLAGFELVVWLGFELVVRLTAGVALVVVLWVEDPHAPTARAAATAGTMPTNSLLRTVPASRVSDGLSRRRRRG
jgi:uncharacterized membrane protein